MTKRTRVAYSALFNYIQREVCPLNVASFMSDFEVALRQALEHAFPGKPTRGCWFHFKKAIRNKMSQTPVFSALLKVNGEARRAYFKLQSLALLPAHLISGAYAEIRSSVEHWPAFREFLREYFEPFWIRRVSAS